MNIRETPPRNIVISRTDSIGDVVLTLPLAKLIKDRYPTMRIAFLGKSYTRPVIECCKFIDEFIDVKDFLECAPTVCGEPIAAILHVFPQKAIAKRAIALKIPLRIGTTNRLYHWATCNKLIRLSRKNSLLHEAQLNTRLLTALSINQEFTLPELSTAIGLTKIPVLPALFRQLIDPGKINLILHPKSQGSAREWGLDNFIALINILPQKNYKIFISGTERERALLNPLFGAVSTSVTDICGKMDLQTFIAFINAADGLVANSTGPLHIAGALGKVALGIYPDIRPMHPGRWQPLGPKAGFITINSSEINRINPLDVKAKLEQLLQR